MALLKRTGPVALTSTPTTNVYNPAGPEIIRNIHIVNHTDGVLTFSLWLGATGANAAGTEVFSKQSVAQRGIFDWPYPLKMATTDFLVGSADVTASALTITITSEQVAV